MAPKISQTEWDEIAREQKVEWLEPVKNSRTPTRARCTLCGNTWFPWPGNVKRGHRCGRCRKVGIEEWDKRAKDVDIKWVDRVESSRKPTKARCLKCGKEWKAVPSAVQQGTGCPECWIDRRRKTREEHDAEAMAVGVEWLAYPPNVNTPTSARCLSCGNEWKAWPSAIRQGHGCNVCASKRAGVRRRKPQSAHDREAKAVGLSWLEPVERTTSPTRAQCVTCGHEWLAWPSNIRAGRGCPVCRYEKSARKQRISQSEWKARFEAAGLTLMGEVRNNHSPVPTACSKCGHHWNAWPSAVAAGKGCPVCAVALRARDQRISQETWDARGALVGVEWVEKVRGARVQAAAHCLRCEYEWMAWPSAVERGGGCPRCAEYGFDPSRPALLYLLVRDDGVAKVGITNGTSQFDTRRFAHHARNGFAPVLTWAFGNGHLAREAERAVLAWWRQDLMAPPADESGSGWTETVDTAIVAVEEIRRRITELALAVGAIERVVRAPD